MSEANVKRNRMVSTNRMGRQVEYGGQNGPITKNRVLPVTTLFFWKFSFRLITSEKKLIWYANDPNAHNSYSW